jgi:hypothetical protein
MILGQTVNTELEMGRNLGQIMGANPRQIRDKRSSIPVDRDLQKWLRISLNVAPSFVHGFRISQSKVWAMIALRFDTSSFWSIEKYRGHKSHARASWMVADV